MNLQATQPHESKPEGSPDAPASPSPAQAGRFLYASGSRPLPGYTIKRGIGHGGFGEVYYATSDAGKEVALKLIRRNWDVELRGVTQCLNLKHPNLLSLYDVKQDAQGDNWVVMELMSGESLEEVLARHPDGLPVPEVLAWIHGIAAGVAYLHDHGIVHRDLKPGNIFVDEGIVKIGDYGLSKFMSCSRRSGQTGSVGTVHYMAPEIANGRYGKEIDIYALGIILYEMLTGHVPFEGESVGEILMKHLTAEPDMSRLNEPYRTIVSRLLAKDPQRRFGSVNELIDLLPPVPAGAALTAAARFAGPNAATGASKTAGYSMSPEFATANQAAQAAQAGAGAQTDNGRKASPFADAANPHAHEEPVVRWFRETWTELSAWWERRNFKPWQKVAILLIGLFLVLNVLSTLGSTLNSRSPVSWTHTAIILLVIYLVFRNRNRRSNIPWPPFGGPWARSSSSPTATPPNAAPNPNAAQYYPPPVPPRESPTRRRWQKFSTTVLYQPGPPRHRFTQLIGSLLLSTLICLVVGLVVMILRGQPLDTDQYAWLASSAVLGSWAVLIPAKFWEGVRCDAALRRFVMLVMGLALGAAAYGLMSWLMVSLHHDQHFDDGSAFRDFNRDLFNADGSPQLVGFLAYFGFLFVIPRWWKQADPLRSTRLSIWHTAVAVFWAWVLTVFWGFPQPWGMMLTAVIAIAVQLSSPWLSPAERAQLAPQPLPGG